MLLFLPVVPAITPPYHGPDRCTASIQNRCQHDAGEEASMKVKPQRKFHDEYYFSNRWGELGFVAGGTGIAPMLQMIRAILATPEETTRMSLVYANRFEVDIMMKDELDKTARDHPDRFKVHYVLSNPPSEGWTGGTGWVGAADLSPEHLPAPAPNVMVLVCGRDEFLETVSGMTARGPSPEPGKKGPKVQGELTGLLADVGYTAGMVYKF